MHSNPDLDLPPLISNRPTVHPATQDTHTAHPNLYRIQPHKSTPTRTLTKRQTTATPSSTGTAMSSFKGVGVDAESQVVTEVCKLRLPLDRCGSAAHTSHMRAPSGVECEKVRKAGIVAGNAVGHTLLLLAVRFPCDSSKLGAAQDLD